MSSSSAAAAATSSLESDVALAGHHVLIHNIAPAGAIDTETVGFVTTAATSSEDGADDGHIQPVAAVHDNNDAAAAAAASSNSSSNADADAVAKPMKLKNSCKELPKLTTGANKQKHLTTCPLCVAFQAEMKALRAQKQVEEAAKKVVSAPLPPLMLTVCRDFLLKPDGSPGVLSSAYKDIIERVRSALLASPLMHEVLLSGSTGKNTFIHSSDLDFTARLKRGSADPYSHDGDTLLQNCKQQLLQLVKDCIDPAATSKSARAIAFTINQVKLDLHLCYDIRPYEFWFIEDHQRYLLEAAQSHHQIEFMQKQDTSCLQVVRALKRWRDSYITAAQPRPIAISYLLELFGVATWRLVMPGPSAAGAFSRDVLTDAELQQLLLACFEMIPHVLRGEYRVYFADAAFDDPCEQYMVAHELYAPTDCVILSPADPRSNLGVEFNAISSTSAERLLSASAESAKFLRTLGLASPLPHPLLPLDARVSPPTKHQQEAARRLNVMSTAARCMHQDRTFAQIKAAQQSLDALTPSGLRAVPFISQFRVQLLQQQLDDKQAKLLVSAAAAASSASAPPVHAAPSAIALSPAYPSAYGGSLSGMADRERQIGLSELRLIVDMVPDANSPDWFRRLHTWCRHHLRGRVEFMIGSYLFMHERHGDGFARWCSALVIGMDGICAEHVPDLYLAVDRVHNIFWRYYAVGASGNPLEQCHLRIVDAFILCMKLRSNDFSESTLNRSGAILRLFETDLVVNFYRQYASVFLPDILQFVLEWRAQLMIEFLPVEDSRIREAQHELSASSNTEASLLIRLQVDLRRLNAALDRDFSDTVSFFSSNKWMNKYHSLLQLMNKWLSLASPLRSMYCKMLSDRILVYRLMNMCYTVRMELLPNNQDLRERFREFLSGALWSIHAFDAYRTHPSLSRFSTALVPVDEVKIIEFKIEITRRMTLQQNVNMLSRADSETWSLTRTWLDALK